MSAESALELIADWDGAFAAGDADRFASLFAEDALLLMLYREAVEGRAAILELWREFSARFDTSAWEPRTELLEVHGDRAYAYRTYTERLLDREENSRHLVRGRLVFFMRRDVEGDAWRISLLMNSHSHPMEPIE